MGGEHAIYKKLLDWVDCNILNYQNRYFILSNRVSVFCALAFSFGK